MSYFSLVIKVAKNSVKTLPKIHYLWHTHNTQALANTTENTGEALQRAWHELSAPYCPDRLLTENLFAYIRKQYSGRGRYYHNLKHLQDMFQLYEQHKAHIEQTEALRFAIFFHDIIYRPRRSDNEARSAEIALQKMTKLNIPDHIRQHTRRMILSTAGHSESHDADCDRFLDFDLGILGSSPEKYALYAQNIRREYRFIPRKQFCRGRLKVLESFLRRHFIYKTQSLREQLESRARENILNELQHLK